MWQCILTLINAGCALLSRDGQGLNYAGNPPISTSTTKLFPHDHTAPSPHQSPSTVEPNLGLEPNPQTLTSGQSLIVDRWFNVNNTSKQLIFKTQPTNLHLLASRGPNCPNYFPCTNYERFGPYIIGAGWRTFDTNYPPKYDFHPLESHFAPNLSFDPSSSFSYFF